MDWGERRIGLAVSDPSGVIASPLPTLKVSGRDEALTRVARAAEEQEVERIVVGLPLDMDGGRGGRARLTETFIEKIRGATRLPVIPWDERLTTVQAERILISGDVSRARRRKVIDQVAAVILLQAWLDAQRAGGNAP